MLVIRLCVLAQHEALRLRSVTRPVRSARESGRRGSAGLHPTSATRNINLIRRFCQGEKSCSWVGEMPCSCSCSSPARGKPCAHMLHPTVYVKDVGRGGGGSKTFVLVFGPFLRILLKKLISIQVSSLVPAELPRFENHQNIKMKPPSSSDLSMFREFPKHRSDSFWRQSLVGVKLRRALTCRRQS
jgi:hypothetical protein